MAGLLLPLVLLSNATVVAALQVVAVFLVFSLAIVVAGILVEKALEFTSAYFKES